MDCTPPASTGELAGFGLNSCRSDVQKSAQSVSVVELVAQHTRGDFRFVQHA